VNVSPLDLAFAAVFGIIFLANLFSFRASMRTYNNFKRLNHDEKIESRRDAAGHVFNWASTFVVSSWLYGAVALFSLAIIILVAV
jgi:uncharacterized membrane protein